MTRAEPDHRRMGAAIRDSEPNRHCRTRANLQRNTKGDDQ